MSQMRRRCGRAPQVVAFPRCEIKCDGMRQLWTSLMTGHFAMSEMTVAVLVGQYRPPSESIVGLKSWIMDQRFWWERQCEGAWFYRGKEKKRSVVSSSARWWGCGNGHPEETTRRKDSRKDYNNDGIWLRIKVMLSALKDLAVPAMTWGVRLSLSSVCANYTYRFERL
jgi:hypothetical protein